jgi:2'-5' RNA ligase
VDPHRGSDESGSRDAALRAFFALELDPLLRGALDEFVRGLRDRPGGESVRWVKAENLHVTLRFLGAIAPTRIARLVRCVALETQQIAPLRLRLSAARIFPSARRPRVVALGIEPEAPLASLAAALERAVVAAGCEPEARPFRPHLTLGRIPPRAGFPSVTASDTPPTDAFDVNEVLLFRSELHPAGARYTPLERVPLSSAYGDA